MFLFNFWDAKKAPSTECNISYEVLLLLQSWKKNSDLCEKQLMFSRNTCRPTWHGQGIKGTTNLVIWIETTQSW